MKRVYHNYKKMEEYKNGMWKTILGYKRSLLLDKAISLTGNHKRYGKYMLRVIKEWPYSCEHNLTCEDMNRRAWIGHAACCLALKCPEDITRQAWHELTQKQQDDANAQADKAIRMWEKNQIQRKLQCPKSICQLTFFPVPENE